MPRSVPSLAVALSLLALPASAFGTPGAARCAAGATERVGTPNRSLVVVSGPRGLDARRAPSPRAPLVAHVGPQTPEGVSSVFLVRERAVDARCGASWYRVLLPTRPNGASGWVRAAGLHRYVVTTRIVVSLRARRLTLWRGGRLRVRAPVAVGRSQTPTPRGLFYVKERLKVTNPYGAYGPAALGLSAFSPVLTGWTGGGPVGIHGTDRPDSIGQSVSNGCVRVPNHVALQLLQEADAGTPVWIVS